MKREMFGRSNGKRADGTDLSGKRRGRVIGQSEAESMKREMFDKIND